MFYAAGAARVTLGRRIRPDRRCDVGYRGYRGYRGRITVAVSRYVFFVVLGRRHRSVFGYMALGHGYVGSGRAQRVGQRGHAGEAHQQTADRGDFVHFAQVFDALALVQHVLGPGQALQPVQLLLGLAERPGTPTGPGHQRSVALAHPVGRVL